MCETYNKKDAISKDFQKMMSIETLHQYQILQRNFVTLIATILIICQFGSPLQLWMRHREDIAGNLKYAIQQANPDINIRFSETNFNQALTGIEGQVLAMRVKRL